MTFTRSFNNTTSVSIINGVVYVNGKVYKDEEIDNCKDRDITLIIQGNVEGNVDVQGKLVCKDIGGDVSCQGTVECGNIAGDIDCQGKIITKR